MPVDGATDGVPAERYIGRAGDVHVPVPRLHDPEIRLDGALDEPAWARAPVLTGFTQFEPVEGIPAAQRTDVRVLYTQRAIYFGIYAHDSRPDGIRARLADRDDVFDDDWVRITLDTYDAQRRAYAFYVNPLGIQADGMWVEGGRGRHGGPPIDFNPDFLFESQGRLVDDGYVVEIRIPLKSLRFPERESQTWGINIVRRIRRDGFESSWAPLTRNRSNLLAQEGALTDLQGLEPGRLIEFNPVFTGQLDGERNDAGQYVRSDPQPELGGHFRYGLTPNLTLDATVNPDFSQVEADVGQVAVNERFALFFPEKRPFFLEGAEAFNTPLRLVHTRQIANPGGGAKLTGKLGRFTLGYLGAVDDVPADPDVDSLGTIHPFFNILRLRTDVGAESNIGFLYTGRVDGGLYNHVGAVDGRIRFGSRYTFEFQAGESWSRTQPSDTVESHAGPIWQTRLSRAGRAFSFRTWLEGTNPGFRTQTGFIRRIGEVEAGAFANLNLFGPQGASLESWGPSLSMRHYFDYDAFWSGARPQEGRVSLGLDANLRGNTRLELNGSYSYLDFQPEDYEDYAVLGPEGSRPFLLPADLHDLFGLSLGASSSSLGWLSLRGQIELQGTPLYAEAARGQEFNATASAELRPTRSLRLDLRLEHSRIHRASDGSRYSVATIPRVKVEYQLSRALFARFVTQYNSQERAALRDPLTGEALVIDGELSELSSENELQTDLLLSFEPSPGTVLFLGYSRRMSGDRRFTFDQLRASQDGLFLKASYLFRL